MKNNRVWVVSGVYYPEDYGSAYFITKIAEGLATEFSVKVLCGQSDYLSRGILAPNREQYNGVEIIRCPATTFSRKKIAQRVINLLTLSISIFVKALCLFRRGNLVLVATEPPVLLYITALACRLRGARYIIRIDDVYPDIMIPTGMLKRQNILYCILNRLTLWAYYRAESILVIGRDMGALVAKEVLRHQERVHVITNWADLDLISPAPKEGNALLRELGLVNKFIVLWAGNMGHPHEIESIFGAMVKLKDRSDIHFIFIGAGSKRPWLEAQVREAGLKNVTLLGYRPRSAQQDILNACDIALSSYVKGMSGLGVPSRMYNIMAASKPILAIGEADSEIAFVINEEKIGWLVPPGQPDQIMSVILQARDNPALLAEMGKRGRLAVETKYSSALAINKYLEIFRDLGKSNK